MHFFRSALIEARLRLTAGQRQHQLRELCQQGRAPMSVLFYHRVADIYPNSWSMTRNTFRQQVDYCREHFQLIGLDEVQRRVMSGQNSVPTVTFTFDDGYAENSDFALPLLAELGVPCTYFVTVGNVRSQTPFPHDAAAGQPLGVNTISQLREADASGIEIGLHTTTHIDFSIADDAKTIQREIFDAKDALEQILGKAMRYFAVPYGLKEHLTSNVIAAAQRAGFKGICSAYGAYNFPRQDAFHIRRIHGDPDSARFRNWLTYDARKLKNQPIIPLVASDPGFTQPSSSIPAI